MAKSGVMHKLGELIRKGIVSVFLWLAYMLLDLPPLMAILLIAIFCMMFWVALISEVVWSMAGFM